MKSAILRDELREAHGHLRELSVLLQTSVHPDRMPLVALVGRFKGTEVEADIPHTPDVEETLAELGVPVIDGDISSALRRFVGREEDLRRALQDRMQFLELQYTSTARSANVLTVVSVVLGGMLLITGALALDLVDIRWIDPAQNEESILPIELVPAGSEGEQ